MQPMCTVVDNVDFREYTNFMTLPNHMIVMMIMTIITIIITLKQVAYSSWRCTLSKVLKKSIKWTSTMYSFTNAQTYLNAHSEKYVKLIQLFLML